MRMMWFCGAFMVLAVVAVAVGVGSWAILLPLGCVAMMAMMMVAMMWAMRPSMEAWRPGRMMGFDGWGGGRETPSEILERRFAEGAISVEEYRERREMIERV